MYEYITGRIDEVTPTYVVVEAAGVGYIINISLHTYSQIERLSETKIYTHYIVREDAQILYGFASRQERELFRLLISVSGVGGNTARMVLSTYSPSELISIIGSGNAALLKNVKGLGLKTAQKIIVELKDKITLSAAAPELPAAVTETTDTASAEAVSALVMLGFPKAASEKAVKNIRKQHPAMQVEEIIKLALKNYM